MTPVNPMRATGLLFVCSFLPALVGQQGTGSQAQPPFVVPAGEILLPNLIDQCAAYLDCNILTNPQEMAVGGPGPVNLRFQKRIETDRDGCFELLASMLYRSGFALTPIDGRMFEVISFSGARGREVTNRARHCSVDEILAKPNLKLAVTVAVPLHHINAVVATNALRPFFASAGAAMSTANLSVGSVGNTSSILLSGMQDQVAQAIRLVRECDVPPRKLEPDLEERLAALERRLQALEERLAPPAAPTKQGK